MAVAPHGREGIFTSLASAPLFAATLPTGMLSGWLLQRYCPDRGQCHDSAAGGDSTAAPAPAAEDGALRRLHEALTAPVGQGGEAFCDGRTMWWVCCCCCVNLLPAAAAAAVPTPLPALPTTAGSLRRCRGARHRHMLCNLGPLASGTTPPPALLPRRAIVGCLALSSPLLIQVPILLPPALLPSRAGPSWAASRSPPRC